MRKLVTRPRSAYLRNVITLVTGTAFAQSIPVLAAPILARQYSPSEFGILALFTSATVLLSVIATLRYAQAVLIPEDPMRALGILRLSIGLAAIFSVSLFIVAPFVAPWFSSLPEYGRQSIWIFIVPISVFLTASTMAVIAWCNRHQRYRIMAGSKIAQTSTTTGVQVGAGVFGFGPAWLLVGFLVGQIASAATLAKTALIDAKNTPKASWKISREEAVRHKNFPLFALPADFINTAANQLPTVLLTFYFGLTVTGHYNLTSRVLAAPIALIGAAILTVFQERAARDFARTGSCRVIYMKTARSLFFLSLVPSLALFVAGPLLFARVFGPEWRTAGEFAQILAPLFFLRFVASPLSYVFYITGKQRIDLIWQISLFALTTAAIVVGGRSDDPKVALILFATVYSLLYLVYIVLSYHYSSSEKPPNHELADRAAPYE